MEKKKAKRLRGNEANHASWGRQGEKKGKEKKKRYSPRSSSYFEGGRGKKRKSFNEGVETST